MANQNNQNNQNPIPPLNRAAEIFEWPEDVTLALIGQRRRHQRLFSEQTRHDALWTRIANHIRHNYRYEVTARQCQVKWYALKRGYENLVRLLSDDPDADGLAIRSPNWYDRRFYEELSDEFWN
jgi:hypothetical protein